MAFIRRKSKAYPWPVEIKRPSETNAGEFETEKFTVKFKRLNKKELNTFTLSAQVIGVIPGTPPVPFAGPLS